MTLIFYGAHKLFCPIAAWWEIRKSGPLTLNFDLWPWNSLGFVRLSRNMFVQNFIELSAAVHDLSCAQRKITRTNTIQSISTACTVKSPVLNITPRGDWKRGTGKRRTSFAGFCRGGKRGTTVYGTRNVYLCIKYNSTEHRKIHILLFNQWINQMQLKAILLLRLNARIDTN